MRHNLTQRKLGRTVSHRMSMLKNLAASVILYEKVETTEAKAKEVRPIVEKLITKAKAGDLQSRRAVLAYLRNNELATKKLFEVLAINFADRPGGYLRMVRLGLRPGDNAQKVQLSLVK